MSFCKKSIEARQKRDNPNGKVIDVTKTYVKPTKVVDTSHDPDIVRKNSYHPVKTIIERTMFGPMKFTVKS